MCESSATCATLRRYLSQPPMFATADLFSADMPSTSQPEEGSRSGRPMLENRLKNYFWWKSAMGKMSRHFGGNKGKQKEAEEESAALKRKREWQSQKPSYKRRRVRGGGNVGSSNGREADKTGAEMMEAESSRMADAYVTFYY